MKKIISLLVLGMVIFTGLVAAAAPIEKNSLSQPEFRITVRSGFGLHIIVENIGDNTAYDTWCFVHLSLFNRSWQGPFPSSGGVNLGGISPGQKLRFHFRTVGFGFGVFSDVPNLYIEVGCAEDVHTESQMYADVLGNIIIIKK